ncbi:hypothetical protein FHL15_000541 [Xylaria flabelliformis]|uniref:Uncharacterized protein n=1 Tax=Xylaria flabelliformis TaxID=2512241 RepID=A0A553IE42_9PEZI|nr:hypothetical protein FHL15_000541 [Xylaria flabelliformis]
MMSVTSAARRLLRTLSLSQPTVMTDLQRDGRGGGPAADGRSWCAAVDGAGTDSSSTSSCFELELWPSQSANSRRLSLHYSSSISISPSADRQDNGLRNGQYHSEPGGETSELRNAARLCIDTPLSRKSILEKPETIPSLRTSHACFLSPTDSSDSASTVVLDVDCTSDGNEGTVNNRLVPTTDASPIVVWSEKAATRHQRTGNNTTKPGVKKSGDEADELFWRGYWD